MNPTRLARLARRARLAAVLIILALIVNYLVVPELLGASRNLHVLEQVSAWWMVAGLALETASLFGYAALTRVLFPAAPRPGLWKVFQIDLAAAAIAHVIPAGTLGSAALGFRLFTREGLSGSDTTVMMATKGIGSTVVLNVLLWLSLVISIPLAGFRPVYGTAAVIGTIVLVAAGLLVFGILRGAGLASRTVRAIGDRIPFVSGERVERAALNAARSFSLLARDRGVLAWFLVWASLNWLLDAASLWCFVAAFGHPVNPFELFAAFGIANVAGALPITPGGLGVVDSIAPILLASFGVPQGVATLGVLGWRAASFWLPIPTGGLAFASLMMKSGSSGRRQRAGVTVAGRE